MNVTVGASRLGYFERVRASDGLFGHWGLVDTNSTVRDRSDVLL